MPKRNTYSKEDLTKIGYRVAKIRTDLCDENNTLFAERLKIAKQTASGLCSGEKSVGKKTIEKILQAFPQVSRTWLVLGEGPMLLADSGSQVINGDGNHHNTNNSVSDRLLAVIEQDQIERLRLMAIIENLIMQGDEKRQ